jgi:hypothetical protein
MKVKTLIRPGGVGQIFMKKMSISRKNDKIIFYGIKDPWEEYMKIELEIKEYTMKISRILKVHNQ